MLIIKQVSKGRVRVRACYSSVSVCLRAMSTVLYYYIACSLLTVTREENVRERVTHTDAMNTVVNETTKAINDIKNQNRSRFSQPSIFVDVNLLPDPLMCQISK